jgi:hypothetical protein
MSTDLSSPGSGSSNAGGGWLLALLIWAAGGAIIGVAAGWIPSDPESLHGPRWVLAVVGLALVACGFAPLASRAGTSSWASQIAGLGTLAALTVIANWVAFGSGPRQFSGGFGIGGLELSQDSQSEIGGRIVFGIGALMLDAFVVMIISRWLRRSQRLERDS